MDVAAALPSVKPSLLNIGLVGLFALFVAAVVLFIVYYHKYKKCEKPPSGFIVPRQSDNMKYGNRMPMWWHGNQHGGRGGTVETEGGSVLGWSGEGDYDKPVHNALKAGGPTRGQCQRSGRSARSVEDESALVATGALSRADASREAGDRVDPSRGRGPLSDDELLRRRIGGEI